MVLWKLLLHCPALGGPRVQVCWDMRVLGASSLVLATGEGIKLVKDCMEIECLSLLCGQSVNHLSTLGIVVLIYHYLQT